MKDIIGTLIAIILSMAWGYGLNEITRNRYDVNGDGEVTAADYVAIRNYIMNKD